jgi:hypothetical protein
LRKLLRGPCKAAVCQWNLSEVGLLRLGAGCALVETRETERRELERTRVLENCSEQGCCKAGLLWDGSLVSGPNL